MLNIEIYAKTLKNMRKMRISLKNAYLPNK